MRDLSLDRYTVEVLDARSGDTHEIYYRMPTNMEMASYFASLLERDGQDVFSRSIETRLSKGSKIIVGFKKGTLGYDAKPFASDSIDPDYRSDWLDLVVKYAPDIVATVAMIAFEGTRVLERQSEDGGSNGDRPLARSTLKES